MSLNLKGDFKIRFTFSEQKSRKNRNNLNEIEKF